MAHSGELKHPTSERPLVDAACEDDNFVLLLGQRLGEMAADQARAAMIATCTRELVVERRHSAATLLTSKRDPMSGWR